jgi:hypothetical protein
MIGISFGLACGMDLSENTQEHSTVGRVCTPVFNFGLKAFEKLDLKKDSDRPVVKVVNETERAVKLADEVVLPEQLVFLPETSADSLLMTRWKTTPFDLRGKGLQPPAVYKKKIGERILRKLGDDGSPFDKGVACYFAGDLFKIGKGSLFSRYVMPKLDRKQPKAAEKYWTDLYKALAENNSYEEIRENIIIELRKRGRRI